MNSAFKIGFNKRAEELKRVSSVAVISGEKILFGKRKDNGRWTVPGGHANKGELFPDAAKRELFEEAGIKANTKQLEILDSDLVKSKNILVSSFKYEIPQEVDTTTKHDPDDEVFSWKWVDKNPLPKEISDNLHVPFKENITLRALEQKGEISKLAQELLKGGLADNMSISKFPKDEIKKGIKVEMEHTNDPRKAEEVAKDHLTEDKKYYTHLKEMENKYASPFWVGFKKKVMS